jgi:hypothetical protein
MGTKIAKNTKHKQLETSAIAWLYKNGCDVFTTECRLPNGEVADALGVKRVRKPKKVVQEDGSYRWEAEYTDSIYLIEAKASRSDLICYKQALCYRRSVRKPLCDFYYLIVASKVTVEDDLYPRWGVINEQGIVVRKAKRMNKALRFRAAWYKDVVRLIAHSLVYRTFGKLYLQETRN